MSPIIRECERLGLDYFVLHSGQHYSCEMDRVFFEQIRLPGAKCNLDVGSNILAGTSPRGILEKTKLMLKASNGWKNPFGDGKASKKIVEILRWKVD